ncbi:nephronectin isoform X6 [Cavia porcellus]|uniref:nephronectin isoform X6 n=1 Tax=Cavia porcellus TaxID=10141 RepID=UPI002FDF3CBB
MPPSPALALALALSAALALRAAADFDGRWPRHLASSIGLCRYGGRIDCCWGWARRSWGQCQPFYVLRQRIARIRCQLPAVCHPQCKHGECVGPNKCKCHPGYAGKTCNQGDLSYPAPPDQGSEQPPFHPPDHPATSLPAQDLNECGLKPRPCKHRCMNTFGSYKCFCLNGHMLMPDGSCASTLTCSMANCQYGCDVIKGQVRCQCPSPGLRLAPDGRTCVDIPKVMIEPSGPVHIPTGNRSVIKGDGGQSNWIPEVGSTRWPLRTPYIPPVLTSRLTPEPTPRPVPKPTPQPTLPPPLALPTELSMPPPSTPEWPRTRLTTSAPGISISAPAGTVDNRIQTDPQKPRGDVFIPRQPSNDLFEIFEIERGVSADDEAKDDPGVLVHSCNFDHGFCGWIKEKDSDLHWEPVRDPAGGQYLTVAAKAPGGRAARLVLPLGHLLHSGDLCLSFKHKVTGLHSGTLQVSVRRPGSHGAALWGRDSGRGWRWTHITLRGADIKSVIFKGERRHGHPGEIGLDDVSLRRGPCPEER